MVERPKHLNAQNSVQKQKKQQEDGHTPDLFSGSPAKKNNNNTQLFNAT